MAKLSEIADLKRRVRGRMAPAWDPGRAARIGGVEDLRAFLLGPWRLARSIDDRRGGQTGSFRGRAVFAAEGDSLHYGETGRLRLGVHTGPARRDYRYVFPRPELAEVCFPGGRPFHDLDLSRGYWEAVHLCGEDVYRGTFRAVTRDLLVVSWDVTGPRKDYTMAGRYRRSLAPGRSR